jgi:hypothetical protein
MDGMQQTKSTEGFSVTSSIACQSQKAKKQNEEKRKTTWLLSMCHKNPMSKNEKVGLVLVELQNATGSGSFSTNPLKLAESVSGRVVDIAFEKHDFTAVARLHFAEIAVTVGELLVVAEELQERVDLGLLRALGLRHDAPLDVLSAAGVGERTVVSKEVSLQAVSELVEIHNIGQHLGIADLDRQVSEVNLIQESVGAGSLLDVEENSDDDEVLGAVGTFLLVHNVQLQRVATSGIVVAARESVLGLRVETQTNHVVLAVVAARSGVKPKEPGTLGLIDMA